MALLCLDSREAQSVSSVARQDFARKFHLHIPAVPFSIIRDALSLLSALGIAASSSRSRLGQHLA